jgi:hypothetical protein
MPNITFDLGGSGVKADTFLDDLLKNKEEKNKVKVPLPQVGEVKLEIPPFFAQQDAKGKWRLVNPLTLVRNLATRKGKKSINISRENVENPNVEADGRTPAPPLSAFSQRDQNRIVRYFKGVQSGSAGDYQFKNKQRGFPATLYKNAQKAGLTLDPNTKTYAKNKKKGKAPYIPKPPPPPPKRRQVVLQEDYLTRLERQLRGDRTPPPRVETPPPSPPESPRRADSPPPPQEEEEEEDPKEEVNRIFEELAERAKSAFSKEGEKKYRTDYEKAKTLRNELPEADRKQSKSNRNIVMLKLKSFSAEKEPPPPPPEPEKNELGLTQKELDDAEAVSKKKDFYQRAKNYEYQRIESNGSQIQNIQKLQKYKQSPEGRKENEDRITKLKDEIEKHQETLVKLEKGQEEGTPLWEVDNYLFQLAFKTSVPSKTSDYDKVFKVWNAVYENNKKTKGKGKGLNSGYSSHSDSSSEGEDEPHDPDGGALFAPNLERGLNERSMGIQPSQAHSPYSDLNLNERSMGLGGRLGGKKGMRILYQPDDGGLNEESMGMKPETDGMEAGSLFSMVKDFVSPAKKKAPVEQTISNKELQDLLAKSYEGGLSDYGDYKVDRELSNPISQVYYNEKKRQPIVVHRGSAEGQDWAENARYGLFNDTSGEHFKKAEETQRRAEQRYGTDNLTTIGHSKGATHAEEYGKRGKQIITLNKPVSPYDLVSKRVPENQIDIKTSNDPVSFLRKFQSGNEAKVLESKSYNPLAEHSTSVLEGTGFHHKLFSHMAGTGNYLFPRRPNPRRVYIARDETPPQTPQQTPRYYRPHIQPPSRPLSQLEERRLDALNYLRNIGNNAITQQIAQEEEEERRQIEAEELEDRRLQLERQQAYMRQIQDAELDNALEELERLQQQDSSSNSDSEYDSDLDFEDFEGEGLADKIDFEDIKWGSFTEQFKRFKQQHPKSKIHDLGDFADMILHNPEDYAKRTIKRARFYKNVLQKRE